MRPTISAPHFAVLLFLLLLTSCFAPQKIIQMESGEDEETTWNYGRQVVAVKDGDFEARVFFEDFTKKELIFDVEVVNLGKEEILLQPEQIHLLANNGGKVWSFDPENEILGEQIALSKQEAKSKNTAVAVGVAVAATLVAVAATSDNSNGNGDGLNTLNTTSDLLNATGNLLLISTVAPPPPLDVMPPDLNFWKNYSLRKTTLEQGYKVGGKVVFPRMDESRTLTVVIPVGDRELRASFKQRIFQP